MVPDDFPSKKGEFVSVDPRKHPLSGATGDVNHKMNREIAKQWIIHFTENHRNGSSIKADEIYGILLILGISKTDFARLLKVHKASVTKYIDGGLKPTPPVVQLMLIYLAAELTKEGVIKELLLEERVMIHGLSLTVPEPKFSIKKVA